MSRALLAALALSSLGPEVPFDRSPSLRPPTDVDGPWLAPHPLTAAAREALDRAAAKRARKNARRLETAR